MTPGFYKHQHYSMIPENVVVGWDNLPRVGHKRGPIYVRPREARMTLQIPTGTLVKVKVPTGGVRPDDVFVVVDWPEDKDALHRTITWVRPTMEDDTMRGWVRAYKDCDHKPMGFYPTSLEVVS